MTTITVTAGDSADAMEKVLAQLGPDAYILESRSDGNRFHIRATDDPSTSAPKPVSGGVHALQGKKQQRNAALHEAMYEPLGTTARRQDDYNRGVDRGLDGGSDRGLDRGLDRSLGKIEQEIRQLKQALAVMTLTNASGLKPELGFTPGLKLAQAGYSEELIHRLYGPVASLEPEAARSAFLAAVAENLVHPDRNWMTTKRIICVLGPSGAGKTTLVGKIAANAKNTPGTKPFDLACMTTKPSIVQEPISACARLLNLTPIPLGVKTLDTELGETSRRLVVDIAVSPEQAKPAMLAAKKRFGPEKLAFVLALPGGASRQMINLQLDEYAELNPLIALTKLDECEFTPAEISVLAESSSSIGLMTGSKSFLDGIAIAQADVLKQYLDINF